MPIADGTANTVFVGESMMRPHARLSPQGLRVIFQEHDPTWGHGFSGP